MKFAILILITLVSIALIKRFYQGKSVEGEISTDLTFSIPFLDGKTLYNICFSRAHNDWQVATFFFTDSELAVSTGFSQTPGDFRQAYEIVENGVLKFFIPDDREYSFVRIMAANEHYLALIWAHSLEDSRISPKFGSEFFFFDAKTARQFMNKGKIGAIDLRESPFSKIYLAGKTFYNVYYDEVGEEWKTATFRFHDRRVLGAGGFVEDPTEFRQPYDVSPEGILKIPLPRDQINIYAKVVAANDDYLSLCWTKSRKRAKQSQEETGDFFFFDRVKAEEFLAFQHSARTQ